MFSWIKSHFTAPVFEQDEEKSARAHLLIFIIRVLLGLSLIGLIVPLIWPPVPMGFSLYYLIIIGALLMLSLALILLRQRLIRATSIVIISGTWLAVSLLSLEGGGLHSYFYVGYFLVMFLAGLLLGWYSSLVTFIVSTAAGLYMVFAEDRGNIPALPPDTPDQTLQLWIAMTLFLGAAALLQNTANRRIESTLRAARREVGERKRAEESLNAERNLLRTLIDNLPENIYIKDSDGRFLINNAVSLKILKAARQEDLLGKTDFDLFPREIATSWRKLEEEVVRTGQPLVEQEEEQPWRGDERRWVVGSIIPLMDASGAVTGILGMTRDISERKRAEETLSTERNLLRTLIDNLPEDIFIKDREGRFLINNALSLEILHVARQEDLRGKTDYDFFSSEIADPWRMEEEAVISTGQPLIDREIEQVWRGNERRWVAGSLFPLRNASGEITGIVGMNRDITERRRAEEALRLSEARYRMLVENIPDSVVILYDRDLRLILVDGPEVKTAGFTTKEALEGKSIFGTLPPDFVKAIEPNMRAALEGKTFSAEIPFGDLYYRYNYVPLRNDQGEIIYGMILGQNITPRKNAENRLRQSEEMAREFQERLRVLHEISLELSAKPTLDDLYRAAIELGTKKLGFERLGLFLFEDRSVIGTYGTDENGDLRDERHLKWQLPENSREVEMIEGGIRAIYWEDAELRGAGEVVGRGWDMLAMLWNGSAGIGYLSTDNYFTHKPPRPYTVDLLALYGNLLGNLITQKQTDGSLRRSEARYRITSALISDYAFAYDVYPDGSFVSNWITEDSFTRVTGYTWDHIGATFRLYHPDDVGLAREHVRQTIEGKMTDGEYRIITQSGEIRWLYIRRQPEWDAEHKRVIQFYGVAQDITERKRLQDELQHYALELEQRVEARTAEVRQAKEQIEAILNNIRDGIVLADQNGDIQTANPAFQKMFGRRVKASIREFISVIPDAEEAKTVAAALDAFVGQGEGKRREARVTDDEGQTMDIDLALIAFDQKDGVNRSLLLSAHDITYLKELERFKTSFVANAVHDLSSPVTSLNARLYLLKKTPERLQDHIPILEDQLRQLRELVLDLRSLSELDRGLNTLNLEMLNFNELVTRIYLQYEPLALDKEQNFILSLSSDQLLLSLDRRKCERIVANLISNAIHYTPNGGTIRISTRNGDNALHFIVADEGIGIDKEDLPFIFERFYRAKNAKMAEHTGTGLGLAIVQEMVTAQGGSVQVESEVGKGSTFTVVFPFPASRAETA